MLLRGLRKRCNTKEKTCYLNSLLARETQVDIDDCVHNSKYGGQMYIFYSYKTKIISNFNLKNTF